MPEPDESLGVVGPPRDGISSDFIFGTLATDDLRLAQLRAATVGLSDGSDIEPRDPVPGQPVRVRVRLGPRVQADRVSCYYTTGGMDPAGERGLATAGHAVDFERTAVDWDTLSWAYVETWIATIPAQPAGTLVRYRIEAWSSTGGPSVWATEVAGMVAGERPAEVGEDQGLRLAADAPPLWPVSGGGTYAYAVDDDGIPDWLRDAVIYQVFIDRFATTGDRPFDQPATPGGFYGGTLRGLIEHLDHMVGLGVTCLWLSPLYPSPSHHGYDTTDYMGVEPRLGTEDDVGDLVAAAHALGIRVILDFVANHVSSGHPAFQTASRDQAAPQASWFHFTRWPDRYLAFFGVADHPQIDTDDPGARNHLIAAARHWLDLGVDGFRCDFANGPSHAFWSEFRMATRSATPDSVTIGEVVETPALQRTYAGRLDGCLDFVLLQALRGFFAFGDRSAGAFEAFLRRHLAYFGEDLVLPSFLDNHDMNRFLWIVGGDTRRLKLAALCQFTLPHPPIVYYGTEIGLSQERDVRSADGSGHPEESRLPMLWDERRDLGLLDFYRRLVAVRREHVRTWRGERRTVALDDAGGMLAYACSSPGTEAIVAFNTGGRATRFRPDTPDGWQLGLVTDEGVAYADGGLTLPALSGAILLRPPVGRETDRE